MQLLLASLSLLFPLASGFIGVSRIYKLDDLGPESLSWRIRGTDGTKGNWKIRQMTFFNDYKCKKELDMSGASFTSSMGSVRAEDAFDNDPTTVWEHDDQVTFFLGFDNDKEVSVKCIMIDYDPDWKGKGMPHFYIERLDLAGVFIDKYEVKGVSKGQNFINLSKICVDRTLFFWGDGQCSPDLRNEECGWDGGDCGDTDSPSSNVGLIAGIVGACIAVALACAALYFKKRQNGKQLQAVPTAEPTSVKREVTMVPMGNEPEFETSPRLDDVDDERVRILGDDARRKAEEVDDEPEFETSPRLNAEDDERIRIFADAARRKAEQEIRAHIEAERKAVQMKAFEEERVRIEAEEAAKLKVLEEERLRVEAEEVSRLKILEEERIRIEAEEALKVLKALEEVLVRTETEEGAKLQALEEERLRVEAEEKAAADEVAKLKAQEEERLRVEAEEKAAATTTELHVEVPTEPEEDLLSDKNQQVRK